jgi:hypothetical protein
LLYDCWDDHYSAFLVPTGKVVVSLLSECFGFVFYVTNERLEFILSQNDHDYLLGAGTARAWVESLKPRQEEWVAATLRDNPQMTREWLSEYLGLKS